MLYIYIYIYIYKRRTHDVKVNDVNDAESQFNVSYCICVKHKTLCDCLCSSSCPSFHFFAGRIRDF